MKMPMRSRKGGLMPFQYGRRFNYVFVILICFVLSILAGCSNEAKKERHWGRGEKYFSENKFNEAIIEYKNVLQIEPKDAKEPNNPAGLLLMSSVYLAEKNVDGAIQEASKAIKQDPKKIDAYLHLASL